MKDDKVPRGSFLIIENLDRLTRENIRPATRLCLDLIDAGIRIVQLDPPRVFDEESTDRDLTAIILMVVTLSRGHGESWLKSDRVSQAWAQKRKRARENGGVVTRWLPAWIEEQGGKLHLISAHAAVVKRIFSLAAAGYGHARLVKKLTVEGVPAFGQSGHWTTSYVATILKDRRALGEYQPRKRNGTPDGELILGYFPAVVTEAEWHAVRAGAVERKKKRGRIGEEVNVFAGLLRDARSGESYFVQTRNEGSGGRNYRVLVNFAATQGRDRCFAFPFATFEAAVLALLAEIDPHEILNGDSGPDATLVLAGELARVEGKIAELEAELLKGDVSALAKVLRQQEALKRELAGKLAEVRQKAAHPLSEAWGEAQSLLATLDAAPDSTDVRLRLRSALRRMLDSIWLLVVPRGRDRLAAVQLWFADGKRCRDYLILHRPPQSNGKARQEGQWWVRSLASVAASGSLDLRNCAHAKKLEAALAAVELSVE